MKIKSLSTTIALTLLSATICLPEMVKASPKPSLQVA